MATKTKLGNKHAVRPRRTNAERSAATRGKLIQAAIDLLYEEGYSPTTTISVAQRAHVSRGAMLHQFPTRVELLLAVAEHIVAEQSRYRRESLGLKHFDDPMQRFYFAADVSWEVHSKPSAIALLEIMMATRSDKALRKGFTPFLKLWADMRNQAAARMAESLGIADVGKVADLISLHQTSMRGLAIELMFTHDPAEVERLRQLQAHFDRTYMEKLVAVAKADKVKADKK